MEIIQAKAVVSDYVTYRLNHMSDWPPAEYKKLLGYVKTSGHKDIGIPYVPSHSATSNGPIDWR